VKPELSGVEANYFGRSKINTFVKKQIKSLFEVQNKIIKTCLLANYYLIILIMNNIYPEEKFLATTAGAAAAFTILAR